MIKRKLLMWEVAFYSILVVVFIAIVGMLVFVFFPDIYLNKYFKYRIIKEFTSANPGYSIRISDLHFNILENSISLGAAAIYSSDSTFSCSIDRSSLRGIGWVQLIWNGVIASDALAGSVAKHVRIEAEGIVSKFRNEQYEFRCKQLYVSLHDSELTANVLEIHPLRDDNQFFDENEFRRIRLRMVLPQIKVNGIAFLGLQQRKICHTRFIQINDASIDALVNMDKPCKKEAGDLERGKGNELLTSIKEMIDVDSLRMLNGYIKYVESYNGTGNEGLGTRKDILSAHSNPNAAYEFRYGELHVSLHDSELAANDLEIHPSVDDNQYFDESKFRRTRFRMVLPQIKVSGLDYTGLLQGDIYHARFIQIRSISLDVLVNMYKPYKRDTAKTLMPNEMLASMKEIIHLDSLRVLNGKIKYGESYAAHANPGVITIDKLNLLVKGINNNNKNGDTAVIQANANFMGAGKSEIILHVPLTSPKFSLRYSGSLGRMEIIKINPFLENAEYLRIKSGIVYSLTYDIEVNDGQAKGYVRGVYKDLKFAILDKRTGSEKGIGNRITSFFVNTFKIRSTHIPDKSGAMKLGKVRYSRKRDESFIQYTWFAYRTGLADVLGFEIK